MNECRRLGIRNFHSNRQPGQIDLLFDLCINDPLAPRHVSSKGESYDRIYPTLNHYGKPQFNCSMTKKSIRDWSRLYVYLKVLLRFMIDTICLILCVLFQYLIYLLWYLLKAFLTTIVHILTRSIVYRREGFFRCYHHHRF